MKDIYLLVEHGKDQGEAYILGWFDDKESAQHMAEAKEWQAYRAALSSDASWALQSPIPPDQTKYRRFWVQEISKLNAPAIHALSAVH